MAKETKKGSAQLEIFSAAWEAARAKEARREQDMRESVEKEKRRIEEEERKARKEEIAREVAAVATNAPSTRRPIGKRP